MAIVCGIFWTMKRQQMKNKEKWLNSQAVEQLGNKSVWDEATYI